MKILAALLPALFALRGADAPARGFTANATNRFAVTGMDCNHCALGIGSELRRVRGVATAEVSFTNGLAVVAYDTNKVSTKKLVKVIKEAGYEAKPLKD
jgi:copper chaperone CopZ